ncbi:hypothetical protein QEM02_004179 [Pseudomonas putida]|uniref:hypothetical protein n=1 Tax=Pseudomonas sp. NBRC 111141 TaxID=1661056 RepID=UPI000863787F|nr:hypothetical protein [Pseudomonas sp. NBRC 111141]EKT4484024.1 hypothetical protein [Pseudomonas putida]EKT4502706.1 hypothetical protein [Pseudomonas putida]
MAIEWPTQVCPAEMSWGMVYNNRDFSSTLNNSQQIVGYPGSYWKCSLSLPPLTRDRDRIVTAFMGRLQGRFGTFKLPAFTRKRTDNIGAPVVQTGSAMASTITLSGLQGSRRVFSQGDYITIDGVMHEVVEDVVSSSGGTAVLPLNRRLRSALVVGTAVEYRNPYSIMRLAEDSYTLSVRPVVAELSFECREAF